MTDRISHIHPRGWFFCARFYAWRFS